MKTYEELKETRLSIKEFKKNDGGWAVCYLPPEKKEFKIVFSIGDDWDHVSVMVENRCPTWEEMNRVKDIFFYENEKVMQLHPIKKDYINLHPYVLHMWRPQKLEIPTPPKYMV